MASIGNTKVRRSRGRPRAYDRDRALATALDVFWRRGFSGTSLDHLTAAMEMSRPSLYAAFGNKRALYDAAVAHYVDSIGGKFFAALAAAPTFHAGVVAFFDAVIDVVTGAHGPLGCIVACTLPAEAGASTAAKRLLADILATLDKGLLKAVDAAVRNGELAADTDRRTTAEVITSQMLALSIRARAGADKKSLRRQARAAADQIAGAANLGLSK